MENRSRERCSSYWSKWSAPLCSQTNFTSYSTARWYNCLRLQQDCIPPHTALDSSASQAKS